MAVTQLDFSVALILGLAPGLAVMYWSIRRFDIPFTQYRLFDDRRLFGGLAIGMIFGAGAGFFELADLGNVLGALLAFAVFIVFEETFKMVWLNRKPYSGRFDTTFYGVPIGAGTAAMLVVANILSNVADPTFSLFLPESFLLFVLFSVSLNLIHVDTGILIGFGASRGEMMLPFLKALFVRLAHAGFLLAFLFQTPEPWSLIALATSIAFAAIVYHYAYTVLLPGTLPEDLRRELKREKRRARKAKA